MLGQVWCHCHEISLILHCQCVKPGVTHFDQPYINVCRSFLTYLVLFKHFRYLTAPCYLGKSSVNISHNMSSCAPRKKASHMGIEWHEADFILQWTIPLMPVPWLKKGVTRLLDVMSLKRWCQAMIKSLLWIWLTRNSCYYVFSWNFSLAQFQICINAKQAKK